MKTAKFRLFINLSMLFSTISSIAIILAIISINFFDNKNPILNIAGPLIFWLGLLLEQLFIWCANAIRKKLQSTHTYKSKHRKIGAVSFMKTGLGTVCDAILIISIIVYIVLSLCKIGVNFVQYILLFLIILSFRLHCIANGKNYRYKISLRKKG